MALQDACRTVEQFLFPCTLDEFLDKILQGSFRKIDCHAKAARTDLLGSDPNLTLSEAFHLAPKLTFHSANPSAPPPSLLSIADADTFRLRLEQFHVRNYSVRFPELRALSPALDSLARAFEMLFHQPVTASAFWSRKGMRAPVHFDDHDLIVVQLRGAKRWYISSAASQLNNSWRGIPGDPPQLGAYETIDLQPGDLLYLPRGTLHSVDSAEESIHLSLGFTPLTVRDAVIGALDHLSDMDQTLRMTIGARLAFQLSGAGFEKIGPPILDAVARLWAACGTPGFLREALQRRSARAVASLQSLPASALAPPIGPETVLAQNDLAFCHLTANWEKIDVSYPGGHVYVHLGAQEAIIYMANTPKFRVRDIPGAIAEDVRMSLASKFVEIGFLKVLSTFS
jgi:hypothetical protein